MANEGGVSSRKDATIYFTLTSRTHAHVLRNLSQGLVASVQVPMPRQTKYYDVRLTRMAVRVLADRSINQTVAEPNHLFKDGLGVDMLRACASLINLQSSPKADVAAAVKGPISLFYPDPVAALSGRAVSYNHPVPRAFCNVICPIGGPSAVYVTNGSRAGGGSLFSPYGSWLLQYRPRASQDGFVKVLPGALNATLPADCRATPCTFHPAEALQLEFDVTYREVLDDAFWGSQAGSFFGSPAGDEAAAQVAGILPSSPTSMDPYLPAIHLINERTPLEATCDYRASNNSLRVLRALNMSYSTATPACLAARQSSEGAYASFGASSTTEPASQVDRCTADVVTTQ
ncbi:hypothetical protein TSOC_011121 [Tetrabaena socialis]|uniref:Uncharacterized protein n=1 Tax=Tetrabaena socialis TaxID=47790 RepID=A0A2J7ZRI2_9CHLO|nr:hypothetical protein TSOC_011121 [Tetrabaena socialis]|eukprot:PNH02866.1 hypothetical protein TSOC_011121 [Tetrabaena socialis]